MTSHDVRSLQPCIICGGIGIYKPKDAAIDMALVVALQDGSYAHPKCLALETLVDLADSELGNVRLCDVSQRTMAAIMHRKKVGA